MSLFIGNLSPPINKDELERVFRRFGQCDVRMKDGYGFVVYEFPPNAEKALKALQKKYICGQLLNLTWSKKQPRPFVRHGRSVRRYEPQHGGYSARGEEYGQDKLSSPGQEDYRILNKHEDENGRRFEDGRRFHSDMREEEAAYHHDNMEGLSVQEHHSHREDEMEDYDRWDHKFDDRLNRNDVDNGIEYDRYEPCRDRNDDNNSQLRHSGRSPSKQSFPRDRRKDDIGEGNLKRYACYSCGGLGHKMWNCPEKTFLRKKWSKFNRRGDENVNRKGRSENEMERSRSRETHMLERDLDGTEKVEIDIKSSSSKEHQSLGKYNRSPTEKDVGTFQIKHHERKKRNRKRSRSPNRRSRKRGRRSVSSPPGSGDKRSRSVVKSSKHTHTSNGHSRSRSISSRAHSSSSGSTPPKFRKVKLKSPSSSPASLSLSMSLGQTLPSANKAQLDREASLDTFNAAESREIVVEKDLDVEIDTRVEDSGLANEVSLANPTLSLDLEREVGQGELLLKDNNENFSAPLNDVINPSTSLTEKGTVVAMSFSPQRLRKIAFEYSGTSKSTDVSSEELCLLLKHYGLDLPDEDENHLNPETCFGSARLWPWEIIYYRRLKKGPISIENYARRMEQNHKFGIVDKYIRSSSGWIELDQGNEEIDHR
ncbi:hypothetical protein LINPERHAP2_LOCUS13894 [Linum perenne]